METGGTYPEIIEKFQNRIKITKTHREKERERKREERTWETQKGIAMVGQTNADCDGLSSAGYGGGRLYEFSRIRRVWTKEIARVLIAE